MPGRALPGALQEVGALKGTPGTVEQAVMALRPLEPRKAKRTTRHTSCELDIAGKTYTGVIVDHSATGIFVRTNVQPVEGAPVRVLVRRPGGEIWEITTRVARRAARPRVPTPRRGVGLIIEEAPHAYHVFVSTLPQ